MALARLLISEVRRYPELLNASRPKGFPREVLTDWLGSRSVRAKYQIEDPEDAAAMLLGMVMQDSGFKLMMVSDRHHAPAPDRDPRPPRRLHLPARRTQGRLTPGGEPAHTSCIA